MNCPVCSEKMKEIVKSEIALDICPGCKGVWLDRGELERLMEFAATAGAGADVRQEGSPQVVPPFTPAVERSSSLDGRREYREGHKRDHDDDDHDDDHHGKDRYRGRDGQQGQYPRKKSSWVSNIFEMFGD